VPVRRLASDDFEGSAVVAQTPDGALLMAYFQRRASAEPLRGLQRGRTYRAQWFDPRTGGWIPAGPGAVQTDEAGACTLPAFPDGGRVAERDWALKLTL
jgi:hypothetical protein